MPGNSVSLNSKLDCLYYPFSRLLDSNALKYLLLIFDSISFLDEAQDSAWRRLLFKQMWQVSPFFGRFEALADEYSMLEEGGILRILNPRALTAPNSDMVAMSVLADLEDRDLLEIASRPDRYGPPSLPHDFHASAQPPRPTWQIFQGKIPSALHEENEMTAASAWMPHVLRRGDAQQSWSLSYEAGSVCTVNYYLEAAQELGLAPITTSELHHQLVLRKLKRMAAKSSDASQVLDDEVMSRCRTVLGHGEILRLMGGIFLQNNSGA
jgi:hypothetical protein